ncbi:endonuclease/exonuclease/phosphatase family protein [Vibrio neonatus]|uniref:endonuclease/exonuclease/phosphatase family protein n=1 Tax=Vibrio neonatus TaxID=278860 RepID=UPI0021C3BD87|nr:endonuclease/exonuclease/phosphatase family protein [Vibrio neonatus]
MKKIIRKKALAFTCHILLLFCVPAGAYAAGLKLTTWNLAWLSTQSYPQFAESQRDKSDFSTLSRYLQNIEPDLLAFQEVDSIEAIQRVVDSQYTVLLSERALAKHSAKQFSDINQYTGVAFKKDLNVVEHPDLDLNVERGGKLRFATYIEIRSAISSAKAPTSIHLLSVHLKAGCQGKKNRNRSCDIVQKQAQKLNQWIVQRESHGQPYIILGDFNHNLAYKGDWLWKTLTQHTHKAQLASKTSQAKCEIRSNRNPNQTHRFRSLIDHIIVSSDLSYSLPKQNVYAKQDVLNYQLSDHCPVSFSLLD